MKIRLDGPELIFCSDSPYGDGSLDVSLVTDGWEATDSESDNLALAINIRFKVTVSHVQQNKEFTIIRFHKQSLGALPPGFFTQLNPYIHGGGLRPGNGDDEDLYFWFSLELDKRRTEVERVIGFSSGFSRANRYKYYGPLNRNKSRHDISSILVDNSGEGQSAYATAFFGGDAESLTYEGGGVFQVAKISEGQTPEEAPLNEKIPFNYSDTFSQSSSIIPPGVLDGIFQPPNNGTIKLPRIKSSQEFDCPSLSGEASIIDIRYSGARQLSAYYRMPGAKVVRAAPLCLNIALSPLYKSTAHFIASSLSKELEAISKFDPAQADNPALTEYVERVIQLFSDCQTWIKDHFAEQERAEQEAAAEVMNSVNLSEPRPEDFTMF